MPEIILTKGYITIVDAEDYKYLMSLGSWWANTCPYACRSLRPGTLYMHKVILSRALNRELLKGELGDHINGNKLDNRRENLRLATTRENQRNRNLNINNRSGFKGVTWHKRDEKWQAHIGLETGLKYLGAFRTKEEAAKAYNKAAIDIFGDFAKLNVIE